MRPTRRRISCGSCLCIQTVLRRRHSAKPTFTLRKIDCIEQGIASVEQPTDSGPVQAMPTYRGIGLWSQVVGNEDS